MKSVYGVKIYLTDRYTEDTSIGLYAMPSPKNSQLRYITADAPNTPYAGNEKYKSGFITDKTLIRISTFADIRRQGGVASSGEFSASFDNTSKLLSTLNGLGIYLNGCIAELVEFDISSQTRTVIASGICEVQGWSESDFTLRVNDPSYKRKANIATTITDTKFPNAPTNNKGKITPLLYGKTDKHVFRKIEEVKEIFNTGNYFQSDELIPLGEDTFPVVGIRQNMPYNWSSEIFIQLGTSDNLTPAQMKEKYDFRGKWIYVTDGKNKGYYRKIAYAYWKYEVPITVDYTILNNLITFNWRNAFYTKSNPILRIGLEDALPDICGFNQYGTGTDQTFVQIMDLVFAYVGETEDCEAFLDENGNTLTSDVLSYVFDNKQRIIYRSDVPSNDLVSFAKSKSTYQPLSIYNVSIDPSNPDQKNQIIINNKYIKDDLETIYSYYYYSPKSIEKISTSDLSRYTKDSDGNFKSIWDINSKVQGGIFSGLPVTIYQNPTDFTPVHNKSVGNGNYVEFIYKPTNYNPASFPYNHPFVTIALELELPDIPDDLDFENMYLACKIDVVPLNNTGSPLPYPLIPEQNSTNIGDGYLICRTRRFWGGVEDAYFDIKDDDTTFSGTKLFSQDEPNGTIRNGYATTGASSTFDNFLDQYWIQNINTLNHRFYSNPGDQPTIMYGELRSGYSKIKIPNAKGSYNKIRKCGLFIVNKANGALNHGVIVRIHEIAFMFECKFQLADEIYIPFAGRKLKDGNFISSPVDTLRDICKRQNWSDVNTVVPYNGWGKDYPDVYKVKETADTRGSYDYTHMYTGSFEPKIAAKLLDYDDCWTDIIKDKVCRQFWLLSYTNRGYEEIESLSSTYTSDITESITLDDIVGDVSPLIYPNKVDIFCAPFVKYAYDPTTNVYLKEIRVTNTEKLTYNTSYVETIGVTVDDAESIWNSAKSLYTKYQVINEPPQELTDLNLIEDDDTAIWYLKTWLWWMDRVRVRFKIAYDLGRSYYPGMRFNLTLPHHTNNVPKVCMIEKLDKEVPFGKLSKGIVNVDAIILT